MWSWEQGFSEKGRERSMIRTRQLIASLSSLPPSASRLHTFRFVLALSLSVMCVCVVPSWQDSGNKAASLPDYSSLLQLQLLPPASLQPRPQPPNPATAWLLFSAVCPPERSSVWISTRHNAIQEPQIITLFIMQKGLSSTLGLLACLRSALITPTKSRYDTGPHLVDTTWRSLVCTFSLGPASEDDLRV